ncbi:hypothetical protein DC498_24165 [Terrimonas sp.]|uniref:hypothetical protein n=1 Tax=Terrimonas sp. TaxID=1914338 RepID=UPI000D5148A0|nr:hypothetical protein [Terrimonas sp.]PVD49631.1 hypothetical protein DC498_24165 [Terrimonas sp.]
MSIFPKRNIPGSTVTIHWNFNTAHITDVHVCPYVRIGVQSPDGTTTMLFEQHVLGLPAIQMPADPASGQQLLYLNKNTPLLVLADYLSTHHKRAELIQILQNIQAGRHYYFTYPIPQNAPLGKYTLISEVYNGGNIKYSATASDDSFFVEHISVKENKIINHSCEPTPVKIVTWQPDKKLQPENIAVFEMQPGEIIPVYAFPENSFLCYNEERIILSLQRPDAVRCIRNQQALCLSKDDSLHVLLPGNNAFTLENDEKLIWEKADGITQGEEICTQGKEHLYREMIENKLIIEIKTQ